MSEVREEDVQSFKRNYKLNFFACPDFKLQIPILILLSLLTSLILFSSLTSILKTSLFIFFIPTFIAAVLLPFSTWFNGDLNINQSFFIAIISLLITFLATIVYFLFGQNITKVLVVSMAIPISLRYMIFKSTFIKKSIRSLPMSIFQSLISLVFVHIFFTLDYVLIGIFILISILAIVTIEIFFLTVDRPFKKDFDITARDLLRIALQLLKNKEKGRKELEGILYKLSIKADVGYALFSFKTESENKALFVIPNVHPGPMKGVGGGLLTKILNDSLDDYGNIFTFHGTATHKLNPVGKKDCKLLAKEMKKDLGDITYTSGGRFFKSDQTPPSVYGYQLGDGLFAPISYSPLPTEDIDSSIGMIMSQISKKDGFSETGVVDAHNCVKKGCTEIFYPSDRAQKIINGFKDVLQNLKRKERTEVRLGTSCRSDYEEQYGISSGGIRTAILEIGGKKNALVLIDGNNLEKGMREKTQGRLEDLVDVSEVMTTDNHSVNTFLESYNPVGLKMDQENLIEDIYKTVKSAEQDLESVKIGVSTGHVEDFNIMGPISTDYMDAVIKTVYYIVPMMVPSYFALQILGTILILSLIP